METSAGIRDRVFAAADALHAETGRRNFPTVDAVRKRAQVNMNDASTCMKEWRRSQTSTVTAVPAQLPSVLQESCLAALAALWKEATTLANDALRVAQAGWEAERADNEVLYRQMADAYDSQAAELERGNAEINDLKLRAEEASAEIIKMRLGQAVAERNRESAVQTLGEAQTKLLEVGQRIDEMRSERDAALAETSAIRSQLANLHASYVEQIEKIRIEARRDIEVERERVEREGERLQSAITLALQHATGLPARRGASGQQEQTSKTSRPRKRKPDGDASGNGGGSSPH